MAEIFGIRMKTKHIKMTTANTPLEHNSQHPRLKEVQYIILGHDEGRMFTQGGYPSDWIILGDIVIWANLDYENRADLIVQNVDDFLLDHDDEFEFLEDEELLALNRQSKST